MAVTEQAVTYRTSDGMEFKDRGEADMHEAILAANRVYAEARQALVDILAKKVRTADGQVLDLRYLYRYYTIDHGVHWPRLVSLGSGLPRFDIDERGWPVLVITHWGPPYSVEHHYIDRLFVSERAAKEALLVALEEAHARNAEEIALLREELYPSVKTGGGEECSG